MIPAIVLSAHTMALGVVRALGQMQVPLVVVHYDPRDMAHTSRYVTEKIAAPHPEHAETEFIELLLSLSTRWPGAVLLPVSDETLMVTARHKEKLAKHFVVGCPDYQLVCQVVDKQQTYPLAAAGGVAVPRTLVPHSLAELKRFASEVVFPCLLKPSQSHLFYAEFGVKMYLAENPDELQKYYLQAEEAGLEVMVQEFIPGADGEVVNYNVYAVDGQAVVEFTSEHIRNAPPFFGSPRVAKSSHIAELKTSGRKLVSALNYTGYACVEFKRDHRDGLFKLMEVNGRHNLSTLLSVRCGINFPWIEYRHRAYGEIPVSQSFENDVYWIDLTRDLAYSAKYRGAENYSFQEIVRPYLNSKVWAILDWKDLRPFVRRFSYLVDQLWVQIKERKNKKTHELGHPGHVT